MRLSARRRRLQMARPPGSQCREGGGGSGVRQPAQGGAVNFYFDLDPVTLTWSRDFHLDFYFCLDPVSLTSTLLF